MKLAQIVRIAHFRPSNASNLGTAGGSRAGVRPRAPPGRSVMVVGNIFWGDNDDFGHMRSEARGLGVIEWTRGVLMYTRHARGL